jgi:hypothetical protein
MGLRSALRGISLAALSGAAVACGSSSFGGVSSARPDGGAVTAMPHITPGGYNVCARLDDAVDCFACCASFFPKGQQKLLNAAASCSCAASYCGPLSGAVAGVASADSGAPDADSDGGDGSEAGANDQEAPEGGFSFGVEKSDADTGFPFGQGACGASMCSLQDAPSPVCVRCALGILTGSEGPPLCPASTVACNGDPDCAQLLKCSVFCPAATPD